MALTFPVIAKSNVERGTAPPNNGPLGGTLCTTAPVKSCNALPMFPYLRKPYPPYNLTISTKKFMVIPN